MLTYNKKNSLKLFNFNQYLNFYERAIKVHLGLDTKNIVLINVWVLRVSGNTSWIWKRITIIVISQIKLVSIPHPLLDTHLHTQTRVTSINNLYYFLQCSYIPKCGKNFEESMSLVNVVMENFRKYQQFSCYSDPEGNQKSVILTKLYSSNVLFHSLFWPTCMMAGGVAIVAMVKLTQYLSLLCERIQRINR